MAVDYDALGSHLTRSKNPTGSSDFEPSANRKDRFEIKP